MQLLNYLCMQTTQLSNQFREVQNCQTKISSTRIYSFILLFVQLVSQLKHILLYTCYLKMKNIFLYRGHICDFVKVINCCFDHNKHPLYIRKESTGLHRHEFTVNLSNRNFLFRQPTLTSYVRQSPHKRFIQSKPCFVFAKTLFIRFFFSNTLTIFTLLFGLVIVSLLDVCPLRLD